MRTKIDGQFYFWTSLEEDGESLSVIPLMLGRARIVRHRGYSPADWRFLEGW